MECGVDLELCVGLLSQHNLPTDGTWFDSADILHHGSRSA